MALLALTYIQYIVSLAINAVTGILVSIVILISSVYQIHPFLIGNYFMCIRQMMFAMDDVGFLTQGAVSVGIIFFMAVIGYQILKKKRSVLKKEGKICILNLQISVKKIGADEVLSGITLSMERGKVYGLQGKNGCGKSMLMRVICGLVLPTVGK